MSFIKELKRRNVIRVAVAYVIVAWLLLQVSDTLVPALHLPEWFHSGIALLLILGFPLAMIFAWAYELTPDGLKKEKDVDRSASVTHITGRKLDFAIIAALVLALAYFVYDEFVIEPAQESDSAPEIIATEVQQSIAVLPFVDMSPDKDQEYMSDGIAEEMLNLLAKIPQLRVTARTSAFSFKGKDDTIPEIGVKLNVTYVLEGSVRKAANQIRITAQLIEASTDKHLWSETYTRELEDVFAIQDEIAAEVVSQLQVTLLGELPTVKRIDAGAYALYLQATHILNQLDWSKNAQAESLLRQALQLDPSFTAGWRELSRPLWRQIGKGHSLQEDIRRSRDALDRALAIEPNDAASLAYYAWHVMEFDGDIVRAARLFERAISTEPANENVVRATLSFAMAFGRPEDAVALGEYAIAHNPLCFSCNRNLARAYQNAGRLDEAEAAIRTVQSLFGRGDSNLGLTLLLKGQPQAALEAFGEEQSEPRRLAGVAMAMHDLGRPEDSVVAFTALLEASAYETTWNVAKVHAWMGQIDAAFEAIDKAAERDQLRAEGDIVRWKLLGTPTQSRNLVFHRLHDDPRWQEFLEKYGISAEQLADVQFKVTLPK